MYILALLLEHVIKMQTLKFVRVNRGTSKNGKSYDFTEVSDGLSRFLLDNDPGISDRLIDAQLNEGDDFDAEVHVRTSEQYNRETGTRISTLRGKIVDIR